MGQMKTPKYRLEIFDGRGKVQDLTWKGEPTPERLEEYVLVYGKSLELGGANEHISKSLGYIPYPTSARIIENR